MLLLLVISLLAGVGLAVANGANDNGKPVATLVGSGILSARRGLTLSFWTTLVGSLAGLVWGAALLKAFGGQGLVPASVTQHPAFLPSVAVAAAATVALATRLGLPVSTTHAILGALVGTGLAMGHGEVGWGLFLGKLAGPLLLSPLAAVVVTLVILPVVRALSPASAAPTCACVAPVAPQVGADGSLTASHGLELNLGQLPECRPEGGFVVVPPLAVLLRGLHFLSAGAVSFARGLNDTPKIAAMLLPLAFLGQTGSIAAVALAMGGGGWFLARRVTATMSHDITGLEGQEPDALAGNLATAFLVLLASRWGLPVSTTHVAAGALVGAGASRGELRWRILGRIILAWVTTLPLAAAIAALLALALRQLR